MKTVHFLPGGGIELASSRYRCYNIEEKMRTWDVNTEIHPTDIDNHGPGLLSSIIGIAEYNLRSVRVAAESDFDDVLFFQKGTGPIGTYYSFRLSQALQKNIVFDIDDAIFLRNKKVYSVFKNADIVLAGSHYIQETAREYNDTVYHIPTSVDTKKHSALTSHAEKSQKTIGWIGSPSTLKYLSILQQPLREIGSKHDIKLLIIGANNNHEKVPRFENVDVEIRDWELEKDWEWIEEFDIGVMPLADKPWERGKCAFKAIQYMCKGVPAVSSAVGEAKYVIDDGENGFLCEDTDDWVTKLDMLLQDADLRSDIGRNGRKTVESEYDTEKTAKDITSILKQHF